ncbi:MAG TPA: ANTAR domain-containing protein [Mycobacteriales bacterium]|nr:ANTAR domain-containing protein [Mycobacteriales bacterium]
MGEGDVSAGDEVTQLVAVIDRLQAEVAGLQRAMRTRGLIDMAKGMIVERFGCDPAEALVRLRDLAASKRVGLVEASADVLGRKLPAKDLFGLLPGEGEPSPLIAPAGSAPVLTTSALYRLSAAVADASNGPNELAEALLDVGLRRQVEAVVLMSLDSDGGLALAGQAGLAPIEVSRWRRIPPHMDTLMTRVAQIRRPIWYIGDNPGGEFASLPMLGEQWGHDRTRAVLPMVDDGRLIGVAEMVWRTSGDLDRPVRRYVAALVRHAAHTLGQQLSSAGLLTPVTRWGAAWFQATLDALLDSVMVTTAVRDADGTVVDFQVDFVNAGIDDLYGRLPEEITGRRLLELYPRMVPTGVFDAYVRVFQTGEPFHLTGPARAPGGLHFHRTIALRCTRFLDGLLLTWRFREATDRTAAFLQMAERTLEFGAFEEDCSTDVSHWSDQLYELLGVELVDEPVPLAKLEELVRPAERAAFTAALADLRDRGIPIDLPVGVCDKRHAERVLRLIAYPLTEPDGRVVRIRGLVIAETARDRMG